MELYRSVVRNFTHTKIRLTMLKLGSSWAKQTVKQTNMHLLDHLCSFNLPANEKSQQEIKKCMLKSLIAFTYCFIFPPTEDYLNVKYVLS